MSWLAPPDMSSGEDPHDKVRGLEPSYRQQDKWFRDGIIAPFCDGPCNPLLRAPAVAAGEPRARDGDPFGPPPGLPPPCSSRRSRRERDASSLQARASSTEPAGEAVRASLLRRDGGVDGRHHATHTGSHEALFGDNIPHERDDVRVDAIAA